MYEAQKHGFAGPAGLVADRALLKPRARQGQGWRGVLIALIVLGHNRMFAGAMPAAYRLLYDFHVGCFLVIPFLRPARAATSATLLYPLRTYYRPFCVFVIVYAGLFTLAHAPGAATSFAAAATRCAIALVIANSSVLNWATGFEMFWFLPVFILLSMLRVAIGGVRLRWLALGCVAAALAHVSVGRLDTVTIAALPWGLPIIAYMLLPCLLAAVMARTGLADRVPASLAGAVFLGGLALCWAGAIEINLSDFVVADLRDPGQILAADLCLMGACLFFAKIDDVVRWRPFEALGRYSLQIYLVHGVIGYALVRAVGKHHAPAATALLIAATYAATLALAFVVARLLMAVPIGRWIFRAAPPAMR